MTDAAARERALALAQEFHEAYERLAPSFGYETRRASAVPWEDVPEQNRALMVAVAGEVMAVEQERTRQLEERAEQAERFIVLRGLREAYRSYAALDSAEGEKKKEGY